MGQVLDYSRRARLFCEREGGDFESKGGETGQVKSVTVYSVYFNVNQIECFKNTVIWGTESNQKSKWPASGLY